MQFQFNSPVKGLGDIYWKVFERYYEENCILAVEVFQVSQVFAVLICIFIVEVRRSLLGTTFWKPLDQTVTQRMSNYLFRVLFSRRTNFYL